MIGLILASLLANRAPPTLPAAGWPMCRSSPASRSILVCSM